MSREIRPLGRAPLIALVEKAASGLGTDLVRTAHAHGYTETRLAHNAVFSTLPGEGARITDMAARAVITNQSMGEVVRELVDLGICVMEPDPSDRRAKIVTYTDYGREVTDAGFKHLQQMERRLARTFGEDYETARRVLEWVSEEYPRSGAPPL
jgi:DNA-binding MarR family transcriptional regulator